MWFSILILKFVFFMSEIKIIQDVADCDLLFAACAFSTALVYPE